LEFGQEKKINTQTQGKKITLSQEKKINTQTQGKKITLSPFIFLFLCPLLVSMSRVELENEIKEG
jgi:hypothetical protein